MLATQSSPVTTQFADARLFRQQCFVGGEWTGVGKTAIENPHDRSVLGQVPLFGAVEAKLAIEAANAALPEWRARSARERSDALGQWAALCREALVDLKSFRHDSSRALIQT